MKGPWMYAPVEHTQLGYTLKSLDRLWAVVTVDNFSDPNDDFFGNWLWHLGPDMSSYDLCDYVPVYDRVAEAKAAVPDERWHVLNIGDDTRFERAYLDGKPWAPKASSRPALRMKLDTLRKQPESFYTARCIAILEEVL